MPPRKSSPPTPAPPVMTWGRAGPALVAALISDALQVFFTFFWFTGPALAALYCTAKASDILATWTFGLLGTGTAAAFCTGAATLVGLKLSVIMITIGTVMAFAVGLFGWLAVIFWILISNARLFKDEARNILRLIMGFIIDEVPILGALPALTFTVWRLYHDQIKKDKEKFKQWQTREAAREKREREEQTAQIIQFRATQEAANDALYMQEQAANDEQYGDETIPEEERKAA